LIKVDTWYILQRVRTIKKTTGGEQMQTTIQKWGNSQAIRLPKSILNALLLNENDLVEIKSENNSIIITKATRRRRAKKSLEERFSGWVGEPYELKAEDKEWLNTESVGNEVVL
jgi:antitoxin MazE